MIGRFALADGTGADPCHFCALRAYFVFQALCRTIQDAGTGALGQGDGMTQSSQSLTQMAAQLRSLSIDGSQGAPADTGLQMTARRPRLMLWATVSLLSLAGLAGLWTYGPDLAHLSGLASEGAVQTVADQPVQAPAVPAQGQTAEAAPPPVAAPPIAPPVAPAAAQILGSGYSRAEEDVVLGAIATGRIAEVLVAEGAMVPAGAPLLRIDDRLAREAAARADLAVEAARLAETAAQQALAQQQDATDVLNRLSARGAVSGTEAREGNHLLAQRQTAVAAASVGLAQAEAAAEAAKAHLADHVLTAPFAGRVAEVNARPGLMSMGENDDALLRLFNPASIVVDVDIAERSLADLAAGQPATLVFDAWPAREFAGRIVRIAPILSKERGTVRVSITLDAPPADLRPNMAARATILAAGPIANVTQPKGDSDV